MSPTATLDQPTVAGSTETDHSVIATSLNVTPETTIHQIMKETHVSYEAAEAFLNEMLRITQEMQHYEQTERHFTREEIGELHGILKTVMPAKVDTPKEGTAHWMINRTVFPDEPTLGLMHSGSRENLMVYCDAVIVTVGA